MRKFLVGHFEWCVPKPTSSQKSAEMDISTFRNINAIFSKTVRDRKMINPNFYSESNGESNGLVNNSCGMELTPIERLQVKIKKN